MDNLRYLVVSLDRLEENKEVISGLTSCYALRVTEEFRSNYDSVERDSRVLHPQKKY